YLALEVIDSVGPGGNFMTSPHTMAHMRTQYYNGNGVTDRKSRDKWEEEGSLDTRQRAANIAKKLLDNPKPSYISDDVDKAIKEKFNILI
ncbi:MAG: trimethylamine methyltransferase family protein, partial [Thermodesulfobacteriota bacterium]